MLSWWGRGDYFGLQIIWLELLPLRDILLSAPTLGESGEYHFDYGIYGRGGCVNIPEECEANMYGRAGHI